MTYKSIIAACAVSAACLMAVPAHAVTQKDVSACRAAAESKSYINLDGHRLRFKSEKGGKNRTLEFEAIPNSGNKTANRFKLSCTLERKIVIALKTDSQVKYAKK